MIIRSKIEWLELRNKFQVVSIQSSEFKGSLTGRVEMDSVGFGILIISIIDGVSSNIVGTVSKVDFSLEVEGKEISIYDALLST